ncbi:MAG: hypothetical protein LBF24_00800 [Puniceicoccales bacterium]|nr:hypothetical protein [Puniceicoccales bacterium]
MDGKRSVREKVFLQPMLSPGPANSFRPANSHRVRLGCRPAYPPRRKLTPWCGAFYGREFSGGIRGSAGEPDLKTPTSATRGPQFVVGDMAHVGVPHLICFSLNGEASAVVGRAFLSSMDLNVVRAVLFFTIDLS